MVDLLNSGKPRADIIREYELTPSSFDKWVRQAKQTGSFKEADNLTPAEKELIALHKRNQQLDMENDILKQAAMCKLLNISRQTYYYKTKEKPNEASLEEAVTEHEGINSQKEQRQ